MSLDKLPSLVVDNGSGWMKAGLAQDTPSCVFPSIVGKPKTSISSAIVTKDKYFGEDAITNRFILSLRYPIERGIVTDWDSMKSIWQYMFSDLLSIVPKEHSLLITEPPLNPKSNREKMTEILFETFYFPFLYLAVPPLLALYASGRDTGVVIDSGEGVTHTVPIFKGHIHRHCISRLDMGGRDLTDFLMKIFCEENISYFLGNETALNLRNMHKMKESLAFVSTDYERDLEKSQTSNEFEKGYQLPDGTHIATLGNERFRCVEPLFSPSLIGSTISGIHDLTHWSITKCDKHLHQSMYGNIVLCGGNTMFPYMGERVHTEMSMLAPVNAKVNVITPPYRQYSSWLGGSLLARSDQFETMCIRRLEDYEEYGPSIVHRKCL